MLNVPDYNVLRIDAVYNLLDINTATLSNRVYRELAIPFDEDILNHKKEYEKISSVTYKAVIEMKFHNFYHKLPEVVDFKSKQFVAHYTWTNLLENLYVVNVTPKAVKETIDNEKFHKETLSLIQSEFKDENWRSK